MNIAKLLQGAGQDLVGALTQALSGRSSGEPAKSPSLLGTAHEAAAQASQQQVAQSSRLAGVERSSADRSARALEFHHSAETHVNAALYELDRLRDEIAAVIGAGPQGKTPTSASVPPKTEASPPPKRKTGIAA